MVNRWSKRAGGLSRRKSARIKLRNPDQKETAGPEPRRSRLRKFCRYQRSSCRTLCCDWLASDSAEVAIDWRVDSAWLLAASSLESASVRADEPVCSTLMMFLLKSWRICTIDRLAPKADACERSVVLAVLSFVRTALVEELSRKSVPEVSAARPRPVGLKVTPVIVEVDLPVSLNTSFSVSPFNRLMPLKDASCAVVVICVRIWLYWLTRDARVACDTASATGATAAPNVAVPGVEPTVTAPIVDDA